MANIEVIADEVGMAQGDAEAYIAEDALLTAAEIYATGDVYPECPHGAPSRMEGERSDLCIACENEPPARIRPYKGMTADDLAFWASF